MNKKLLNKAASYLAKHEGNKSQVKIGDIRELIKLLVENQSLSVLLAIESVELNK